MKKQDLTKHSKDEALKLANDKREELRVLRFGASGSKNRDVKKASKLRKEIARALTQVTKTASDTSQRVK